MTEDPARKSNFDRTFSWPGPIHRVEMDFVSTRIGPGRVRVSEHRVGYGGRSKFCFWAGTWGRDVGTSPGFRSPRVTEDPARKPNFDRNFSWPGPIHGWKWISFLPDSDRVGYESRSSVFSVQGPYVGIRGGPRDFIPHPPPPDDRGPDKPRKLPPNSSGADTVLISPLQRPICTVQRARSTTEFPACI
jgi:hypothetical protein